MKKNILIFFIILFLFGTSSALAKTSTSTPSSVDNSALIKQLQALIISLQTQINDLKAKLETTQKDVETVKLEIQFTKSLIRGAEGDEVKQLQEVLSKDPEIYPEGKVTGFFGSATEAAVKRFQEKYHIESLGIIGPKTREKLNELTTKGAAKLGNIPSGFTIVPEIQSRLGISTTTPLQATTTAVVATTTFAVATTTIAVATTTTPLATPAVPATPAQPSSSVGVPAVPATPATPAISAQPTTTADRDTTAPIISNIQTNNITQTTAVVSWSTNEVSTSDVYYSKNASILTSGTLRENITSSITNHSITLSGLSAFLTYYYIVVSKDDAGNTATSSVNNFQTIAEPVVTSTTRIITATAETGGTISPSGSVVVTQGVNKTFTITTNTGYAISTTTVDGVNQGAISTYAFTNVQTAHTISATFTQITYTITATQGANGLISPGVASVISGGGQVFTITPASGYQIASVIVDGVNQGVVSAYTFTNVTSTHSITATFSLIPIAQYSITVTQGTNGSITPSTTSVASGGSQTFTITPANGYQIANLIIDGSNVVAAGTYTFTNVTATHTFSGIFSPVIPVPQFILKWGSAGAGDGQFSFPRNIAVDSAGNVYVSEANNHRVQKFTSDGIFITKWGSPGTGDGQFSSPFGIAIDTAGTIYVADEGNARIQKFTSNGTFITKWGSRGDGDGQFNNPQGIAVDTAGNVYVTEDTNLRVQKFTSNGTFITKWGSSGTGDGQFRMPRDIVVDSVGNVYVTDAYNRRVQKFTSDGTFITKWESYGEGDGQFYSPVGIAVDTANNVYVVDGVSMRVQKFTSNGTFITKWGSRGTGDGQFNNPYGIAVNAGGNIYVADISNNRIQKFAPPQTALLDSQQQFANKYVNNQIANILEAMQGILNQIQIFLKKR